MATTQNSESIDPFNATRCAITREVRSSSASIWAAHDIPLRRWLQTALLLLPLTLHAAPMAVTTTAEGATITIYTEPCALEAVANLDRRATWDEKGVRHEGCAGVTSGVVAFYFEDRTVVLAPVSAFRRVDGI